MTKRQCKEKLGEKYGWKCHYCGRRLIKLTGAGDVDHLKRLEDFPQVDHVVPRRHGGKNTISNYVLCFRRCNSRKGNRPAEVFLRNRPDRLAAVCRMMASAAR